MNEEFNPYTYYYTRKQDGTILKFDINNHTYNYKIDSDPLFRPSI